MSGRASLRSGSHIRRVRTDRRRRRRVSIPKSAIPYRSPRAIGAQLPVRPAGASCSPHHGPRCSTGSHSRATGEAGRAVARTGRARRRATADDEEASRPTPPSSRYRRGCPFGAKVATVTGRMKTRSESARTMIRSDIWLATASFTSCWTIQPRRGGTGRRTFIHSLLKGRANTDRGRTSRTPMTRHRGPSNRLNRGRSLVDDHHVTNVRRKTPQHRLVEIAEQFEVGRVRGRHDDHLGLCGYSGCGVGRGHHRIITPRPRPGAQRSHASAAIQQISQTRPNDR